MPAQLQLTSQNRIMRCLNAENDTILSCNIADWTTINYLNAQFKSLILPENTIQNYYALPVIVFQIQDKAGNYLYENSIKPHLLIGNSENSIWSLGTPNICQAIEWNMPIRHRADAAKLLIFTDNPSRHVFYIDDLIVQTAR